MRIASALTAAFAIAALSGLTVATVIDLGYHDLRDREVLAGSDFVAVASLTRIEESAELAFAATDLILRREDQYYVPEALQQLERFSSATRDLGKFRIFEEFTEQLRGIARLFDEIGVEIESHRTRAAGEPVRRQTYDRLASELTARMYQIQQDVTERAEDARSALTVQVENRHRTDILLLVGYSLFMVMVVILVLRFIAVPVRQLTVNAEDAIDLGHSFRPVSRGPRELKQLGGTISSLVGNLEGKVGERTSELGAQAVALRSEVKSRRRAEVELRKAIRAAESASEAKSNFLSVISHELRTPMNAILGTLTLLHDTRLGNEQRTYVETARDSGQALMALLNDVLDMSKIEAGGLDLSEIKFDLVETLDHILNLFHPECCKKRVVLAGLIGSDVPRFIRGDPLRIRQILTNLVGNAVKFTDDGHILVRIEMDNHVDGGLTFVVEDTGAGISEEDQRRVFAEFAQADRSGARRHGGTGLGLSICQRLVDAMGGTITLWSEPDVGSEFRVTVPLVASERTDSPIERELRTRLSRMDLVITGSCFAMAESLRAIFDGWVASVRIATDPVTLSQIVSEKGSDKTCVICGPPDRPIWPALLEASRVYCNPRRMVAIVPCVPGAAKLAADHGDFGAIYDRSLKPLTLMRLVCGYDVSEQHNRASETVQSRDGNLLLVEDSAANRLVASAILEKAGYTVTIAENGQEALEVMSNCSPDLILMDLQMPVMDGYDAHEAIRAIPGRPGNTPIIALSANVMARSDAERRQIDFEAYLAKPLSRTDLLDTVAEVLDRTRLAGRASTTIQTAGTSVE